MARMKYPEDYSNITVVRTFQHFLESTSAGGIVLIICTALAMIWANSPWWESYEHFWHINVTVGFGDFVLSESLHHWINDGLMVIFFFVVGLEIKREVLVGELSSVKKALLPIMGALGGVLLPALIYFAFNQGTPAVKGWAIPMATDIAFALGVLTLLGDKVPLGVKVFLAALAIVDDLAAVLVIAIFYGGALKLSSLTVAAMIVVFLTVLNKMKVKNPLFYLLPGVALWLAVMDSGIHATIAGVVLAFTIPANSTIDSETFLDRMDKLWKRVRYQLQNPTEEGTENERIAVLEAMEKQISKLQSPLMRLEHGLQLMVALAIMPIFALSNAGVHMDTLYLGAFINPVTLGTSLGLLIGKQFGVFTFVWLAVKLGWATLPKGAGWNSMYAVSLLCGIGFTMSLFVSGLSFSSGAEEEMYSKIGILIGSAISGGLGYIMIKRSINKPQLLDETKQLEA